MQRDVSTFVLFLIDYCSVVAELPAVTIAPLQLVMHATVIIIARL